MLARAVQPPRPPARGASFPGQPRAPVHVLQGERECGVHAAEPEQPHGRAPQEAAGAGRGEHGRGAQPSGGRGVGASLQGAGAGGGGVGDLERGAAAVPAGRDPRLRVRGGSLPRWAASCSAMTPGWCRGPCCCSSAAQPGRDVAGAARVQHGGAAAVSALAGGAP